MRFGGAVRMVGVETNLGKRSCGFVDSCANGGEGESCEDYLLTSWFVLCCILGWML